MPRRIDVLFVVYDGIQALDLTGPFEVLHGANEVADTHRPEGVRYALRVASLDGDTVTTESGLQLATVPLGNVGRSPHTLVVPGGFGAQEAARSTELVAAVRRLGESAERVVTVCSGSFVAAAAGLLDGHRVTTHWARAEQLAARHPSVQVDAEPIYVVDDRVWSSAGVTAGIDLALALVEHDHDGEVAQIVARWLVMFLRRPGGQSQFATAVWRDRAELAPVRAAQDAIDADPGADHRVSLLAQRVGMSERHFTRRFTEEVGASPARYVASVRIEAARRLLETTSDTVEAIARRCGFGTDETMRRTFTRRLGVSPDQYRRRFRHRPPSPITPPPTRSTA
ncbi:MAG: GlxA family transcriptional regulator [Ilumatobacter sp.]|uniref:GlxA family transcriptional regulator n=1 Tax=Ilumatobacter sp. TaxID=1967498 RepID=UPI002621DDDF|nr:GlxA family transcriptional regulator [Ilumatobacter sp.]MDJ0769883.1 GlxA family transcriptional regulator [Ilumatobacter sp.]